VTSAATGAGLSTAGGVLAKALVVKLVVGSSVASLVVGGAIGAGVHSVVATPVVSSPPTRAPAAAAPAPVQPAPPVAVEPPPPPPLVEAPKEPVIAPAPKPPPTAPRLSANEQLSLEKSYLEQARAAMARNDADSALGALAQHAKAFPKGQLTEERMALEVMALSSAGRSIEARNAATAFRTRFPTGLFRSAVDAVSPT
jgi:hypothetical protein